MSANSPATLHANRGAAPEIAINSAQGPIKLYISTLSEDRRQVLKERLRTDILGNRPDGSIMLRAKAWAVRGVVPAG